MTAPQTSGPQLEGLPRLLDAPDDLVTGEAVALDLPAASLSLRVLSVLIDMILTIILLFGALVVMSEVALASDQAIATAISIVATVGVMVALPVALETVTHGKTLGKWILGLRVVRDDAGQVGFRQALARHLVGFLEIWLFLGVPALLSGISNQRSKRVGDFVAGTYVVRERFRLSLVPGPPMPAELALWASRADLTRLPPDLALGIRQFLLRAATFTPAARRELGSSLVARAVTYVSPLPPAGTHPETFLTALLAERRSRESQQLAQQRAFRERLAATVHRQAR